MRRRNCGRHTNQNQRLVATRWINTILNAEEDVSFYVPGRHEVDPLDPGCFTLAIDIQSAAALYSQVVLISQHRGNGDEAAGGNLRTRYHESHRHRRNLVILQFGREPRRDFTL